VPMDRFFAALGKDKKNVGTGSVTVILPREDGGVERSVQPFDERFRALCTGYFARVAALT
jgi:3-dehydroquinate synthase